MTRPVPSKAQGAPLDLSDESLDQAAQVTPMDVSLAQSLWRHIAPPKLADLLDVTPDQS